MYNLYLFSHGDCRYTLHAGTKLTPPVGEVRRVSELGPLLPTDISVVGTTFRESGTDVAIAGLGWIGVAVDGAVELRCVQKFVLC